MKTLYIYNEDGSIFDVQVTKEVFDEVNELYVQVTRLSKRIRRIESELNHFENKWHPGVQYWLGPPPAELESKEFREKLRLECDVTRDEMHQIQESIRSKVLL